MSTNSRFQSGAGKENTARIISFETQSPAFATPLAVVTTKARTRLKVILTAAALTINMGNGNAGVADNTPPFDGDEIEFEFKNTTGLASVVTFGTNMASSGTASVAAAKYGNLVFKFNGADSLWVEKSRVLTA